MFATPLCVLEFFLYVARLVVTPFPSHPCTQSFNKLILKVLEVKAKQGKDSHRDDIPRCHLRLGGLKT